MTPAVEKMSRPQLEDEVLYLRGLVAENTNRALHTPGHWRLTISEERLFLTLLNGITATREMLMNSLYWDRPDDEPDANILRAFMCKLRKKLARLPEDQRPVIAAFWGRGYELERAPHWRLVCSEPVANQAAGLRLPTVL